MNGKMFLILVSAACILAAFGQVLAADAAATAPAATAPTTQTAAAAPKEGGAPTLGESPADTALRDKLRREITRVGFKDIDFKDMITFLKEYSDANIEVNWTALAAAGIKQTTKLTVKDERNITVERVLGNVLDYVSRATGGKDVATYIIEGGVLKVSTKSDLARNPRPTVAAAPAPAPTSKPTLVATVGAVQITSDRIDGPLKALPAEFPAERVGAMRAKILDDIIVAELIHAYLEAKQIPFDQKEYDTLKVKLAEMAKERGVPMDQLMSMAGLTEQRLRDQVRLKTLAEKETAKEKVDAFIKANATCFNGTKVQASHILVTCPPTSSTKDQKAAIAKLEKVAADLKAGTVTFDKAAEANSDCPSKAKGGDLGEFDFGSMVPTFAMKAFSMKIGDTSDIVRTQFGFHIIKVTKRTNATEKPGPESEETAKNCMIASLQNDVFNQALTTCPIVISETK